MNMKRTSFVLLLLLYAVLLTAQSHYDYMDDSAVAGGANRAFNGLLFIILLIIGAIVLLLLGNVFFKIYYGLNPEAKPEYKAQKANEESKQKRITIRGGGFVCPICGKHVLDKNYVITTLWIKGKNYNVKYCKDCDDRYNNFKNEEADYYRRKEKYKELPTWLSIVIFILLIGLGIYVLVIHCLRDEVVLGIWFMIMTPMGIMMILGCVIWLVQKLMIGAKPTKPFETPSLEHILECNALKK